MDEKVASGAFFPPLNNLMGEGMYYYVSIMSAELNAIIMALEYLMNSQPLISNLQNIIDYSDSLSSLELLSSAFEYKVDLDTFHCPSIIHNLASRDIKITFNMIQATQI